MRGSNLRRDQMRLGIVRGRAVKVGCSNLVDQLTSAQSNTNAGAKGDASNEHLLRYGQAILGKVVHTEEVTQVPCHDMLRSSKGEYDWLSGQKPHRRAEQRPQEDGAVASCESHGCQMENSCIPSPSNPATISTQRDT